MHLQSIFTWLLPEGKVTFNLASSNYPCWGHHLNEQWVKKLWTALPKNEWWMATLFWVCIAIMLVKERHLTKQEFFSWLGRRFALIKKMVHFWVSMLMLNSERIALLHLKHKILCSWFLSHHSYSDIIYHVIEIPTSYLNSEIKKNCWKPS